MRNKAAGIYKGVSIALYPDDLLSDQELQGAPPEARGIWCANILPAMWRDKVPTLSAPVDAFARRWGVTIEDAERIIDTIKTHKIGDVSRECPGVISITCRRLKRLGEYRESERIKKEKQRAARSVPPSVPSKKALPPSPLSLSSPPPSPVPVDIGERASAPPPPSKDHADMNAPVTTTRRPKPGNDETALAMLIEQYSAASGGSVQPDQARKALETLLKYHKSEDIQEAIKQVPRGCKPWVLAEVINGTYGMSDEEQRTRREIGESIANVFRGRSIPPATGESARKAQRR